jgi:SAM-dependent methyltransferase
VAKRNLFDAAYYARFYGTGARRARYERDEQRLGDFACAYLKYLGQPVRTVVDLGCGFGWWRDVIAKHFPAARYTGVEISEYLCEEHGWQRGSVIDYRARKPFDWVICKDTLQYLSNAEFDTALDNLARLAHGALYLSLPTRRDWEESCDHDWTDSSVYLRSAQWYRQRLARHFVNVGGGIYLSRRSPVVTWELERLE